MDRITSIVRYLLQVGSQEFNSFDMYGQHTIRQAIKGGYVTVKDGVVYPNVFRVVS
jgi:hypothetical protein